MAASKNTMTLLTDFGLRDYYLGCVKGVLLSLNLDQRIIVDVGGEGLRIPFVRTYGDVKKGAGLALIGSSGMLEIGINQGSMSGRLSSAKEGTRVAVELMPR